MGRLAKLVGKKGSELFFSRGWNGRANDYTVKNSSDPFFLLRRCRAVNVITPICLTVKAARFLSVCHCLTAAGGKAHPVRENRIPAAVKLLPHRRRSLPEPRRFIEVQFAANHSPPQPRGPVDAVAPLGYRKDKVRMGRVAGRCDLPGAMPSIPYHSEVCFRW